MSSQDTLRSISPDNYRDLIRGQSLIIFTYSYPFSTLPIAIGINMWIRRIFLLAYKYQSFYSYLSQSNLV